MSKNLVVVSFLSLIIVITFPCYAYAQGLETSPILWIIVLGVPIAAIIVISLVIARAAKAKFRVGLLVGFGMIFIWFGLTFGWSLIQSLMQAHH
jgi:hypothetical protein